MKWFLYAISLLCIAFGCCIIIYTRETRNFVKSLFNEVDRKVLSVFEVLMGILLLFSATASHYSWFIRLIGILAVIEGGVIFFIPKNLYDELIDWYINSVSDQTYRLFGIISIIFGTAVLSWIL
jgi:uncharacterized protein YjeT (DUF2065 family)